MSWGDSSIDLDLNLYTASDVATRIDDAWTAANPEVLTVTGADGSTTYYVEVLYWWADFASLDAAAAATVTDYTLTVTWSN